MDNSAFAVVFQEAKMNRKRFSLIIWLSAAFICLAACDSTPNEPAAAESRETETSAPAESAAAASVPTIVEIATEAPTSTSTPTSIPTETPTLTPSPVPSDTPSPTPVPTDTPEPTITPTPEPKVIVEISSLNVRGGPGTVYDVVFVAESGDEFAVTGEAFDCQWLKVAADEDNHGWVSGDPEIVTLNHPCQSIPEAEIPPVPTAAFTATPETGGMGSVTFINETTNRGASVVLRTCCEYHQLSAHPGETVTMLLPPDEYAWSVFSDNCRRDLPQLFLTGGMQVIVRLIPDVNNASCQSYIDYGIYGG